MAFSGFIDQRPLSRARTRACTCKPVWSAFRQTVDRVPRSDTATDLADGHTHDAWIDLHIEAIRVENCASALGRFGLAFQRVHGCWPLRAISLRRLDHVHEALLTAKPTDIANRFGILELATP